MQPRSSSGASSSRSLCQFATPSAVAEVMAKWAVRSENDKILDPCFGTAILLVKAMQQLQQRGASASDAAAQAYGIEISKRAISAAKGTLSASPGMHLPHLMEGDFMKFDPRSLQNVDGVVCNPPFKRHNLIPTRSRDRVRKEIEEALGIRIAQRSDLYVYFMLRALLFLKDGGRMAFLTPTQYMECNYGRILRDFLAANVRIGAVVVFDEKLQLFSGSLSTASLLLAEKSKPRKEDVTRVIRVNSTKLEPDFLDQAFSSRLPHEICEFQGEQTRLIDQKWTTIADNPQESTRPGFVPLGDLFEVKRGIATGANKFFVMSEKQRLERKIGYRYLRPVIAKAHFVPGVLFRENDWQGLLNHDKGVWLLDFAETESKLQNRSLLAYIESGTKAGLTNRTLLRRRDPWYAQERRAPPAVLFTYMSNGNHRFILNRAECVPLNNLHCLYPREELGRLELEAVLGYLNSGVVFKRLRYFGREYGRGLIKLEPSDLQILPVPDPRTMPMKTRNLLASSFEDLARATSKRAISTIRHRIDRQTLTLN